MFVFCNGFESFYCFFGRVFLFMKWVYLRVCLMNIYCGLGFGMETRRVEFRFRGYSLEGVIDRDREYFRAFYGLG